MHDQPVARPEYVVHVRQIERDFRRFARHERQRSLEAAPELGPERLAPNELLIAAHPHVVRRGPRSRLTRRGGRRFRLRVGAGYPSMSFTTKSLSVPEDDTVSETDTGPATARSSSSGPVE